MSQHYTSQHAVLSLALCSGIKLELWHAGICSPRGPHLHRLLSCSNSTAACGWEGPWGEKRGLPCRCKVPQPATMQKKREKLQYKEEENSTAPPEMSHFATFENQTVPWRQILYSERSPFDTAQRLRNDLKRNKVSIYFYKEDRKKKKRF